MEWRKRSKGSQMVRSERFPREARVRERATKSGDDEVWRVEWRKNRRGRGHRGDEGEDMSLEWCRESRKMWVRRWRRWENIFGRRESSHVSLARVQSQRVSKVLFSFVGEGE
jgi:hypothetical protein